MIDYFTESIKTEQAPPQLLQSNDGSTGSQGFPIRAF